MKKNEVFKLLDDNKNQRGIENWKKMNRSNLNSFGIGLTVLRKLAKKIGRNAELAAELWETDNYDARIISMLIDDPKKITREQIEAQVEQLEGGYLCHVFSSCDATLGKTDFVLDLIKDWIPGNDETRNAVDTVFYMNYQNQRRKMLRTINTSQDIFVTLSSIMLKPISKSCWQWGSLCRELDIGTNIFMDTHLPWPKKLAP